MDGRAQHSGMGWRFAVVALLAVPSLAACQTLVGLDEGKPRPQDAASSAGGGGGGGQGGGGEGAGESSIRGRVLLLGGGGTSLHAGEFREGGGWRLQEIAGATSDMPALALSAEGLVVGLVRIAGAEETTPLRFTTWTRGGWSPIIPMGPQGSSRSAPSLSAGAAGIQAVYQRTDYKHVFALFGGIAWSPDAEPVGGFAAHSYGPNAADIAGQGTEATVVFMNGEVGPQQNHLFAQRRSEGVWETAQHLADDADFTVPARIVALDVAPGDAMVVYAQATTRKLIAMRRQGLLWGVPVPIGHAFTDARPALAALPGGGAVLAFRGLDGKPHVARYDGGAWSDAELAPSPDGALLAGPPAVTPGVGGATVELVYADGSGAAYHTRAEGGQWTEPALITSSPGLSQLALASAR